MHQINRNQKFYKTLRDVSRPVSKSDFISSYLSASKPIPALKKYVHIYLSKISLVKVPEGINIRI